MSTDVPVHHYNCAAYLFFFGITYTMTFQLVYWGTYTEIHPKLIYLFTFMLLIRLTTKTYLSPQLLVYMSTDVPAQDPTRSFHTFIPRSTRPWFCCSTCPQTCLFISITIRFISYFSSYPTQWTFQLIYCGTYPQIHPKISLPVYPHASL